MWHMLHLFRFICEVKGLLFVRPGDIAHIRECGSRRNVIELLGVLPRTDACAGSAALRAPLHVKVYVDLNTFRMALVPQSE